MKLNQTYVLLILITVLFGCNKNLEKQIINIEKGKIGMIGYGSLMSKKSMERTLKRTYQDSVYLVHLEGYQRSWNASRTVKNPEKDLFYARDKDTIQIHNTIALNIIESDNEKINCVLFFITPEELAQFDIREKGYNRIDVTDKINEYEFIGGEVYVYKADKEHTYSYDLKENTVLPKGYFSNWHMHLTSSSYVLLEGVGGALNGAGHDAPHDGNESGDQIHTRGERPGEDPVTIIRPSARSMFPFIRAQLRSIAAKPKTPSVTISGVSTANPSRRISPGMISRAKPTMTISEARIQVPSSGSTMRSAKRSALPKRHAPGQVALAHRVGDRRHDDRLQDQQRQEDRKHSRQQHERVGEVASPREEVGHDAGWDEDDRLQSHQQREVT